MSDCERFFPINLDRLRNVFNRIADGTIKYINMEMPEGEKNRILKVYAEEIDEETYQKLTQKEISDE